MSADEARMWYIDGPNTHGEQELASVGDERTENMVGIGPDMEFEGTPLECVKFLKAHEFTELETDILDLLNAWDEEMGTKDE